MSEDLEGANQAKLIAEWERRLRVNIDTHVWAEHYLTLCSVTCAVFSIGSLVALGVIAAGFDLTHGHARYAVVALSVSSALASVLLTVKDFGSTAAAHRIAARQYGAMRRDIERIAALSAGDPNREANLNALQRQWDWVADLAPNAPQRIRRRAANKPRRTGFVTQGGAAAAP